MIDFYLFLAIIYNDTNKKGKKSEKNNSKKTKTNKTTRLYKHTYIYIYIELYRIVSTKDQLQKHALMLLNSLMLLSYDENHLILYIGFVLITGW